MKTCDRDRSIFRARVERNLRDPGSDEVLIIPIDLKNLLDDLDELCEQLMKAKS